MYDNVTRREQIKISSDGKDKSQDNQGCVMRLFFYFAYWEKERQITCALFLKGERETDS